MARRKERKKAAVLHHRAPGRNRRRENVVFCGDTCAMPAALLAALVLQATPETLAELERAYDETCNSRLYGQYDGMCSDMAEQVKRYRAELKHRPVPPKPPASPAASSASSASPAEPPPAHEPLVAAQPKG